MNDLSNRMMNQFFRRVSGVKWDLMSGKIGVQTKEGIVTISGEGDEAQLEINLLDQFGFPVPAFAQSTPIANVAVGDLIYQGDSAKGWVIDVIKGEDGSPKRFRLMTTSGTVSTWTPPKVSLLGFESGILVLKSLISLLPGEGTGFDSMKSFLMPMLMLGDGNFDVDKMMPFVLFSQLGTSGDGSDAMGLNNNMLQTMLMLQMFGGGFDGGSSSGFFDRPVGR
jgi:hypothetical protein